MTMTTNQTIDVPERQWLETISECNSAADQLNGMGGPKAKRAALRMKTLGLVIHDRACFLAKQTLKFKIENCEAVMRGQWEKVKFNKNGAVGPKVEPIEVRVNFPNPLTENIPGNPGYQRPWSLEERITRHHRAGGAINTSDSRKGEADE